MEKNQEKTYRRPGWMELLEMGIPVDVCDEEIGGCITIEPDPWLDDDDDEGGWFCDDEKCCLDPDDPDSCIDTDDP